MTINVDVGVVTPISSVAHPVAISWICGAPFVTMSGASSASHGAPLCKLSSSVMDRILGMLTLADTCGLAAACRHLDKAAQVHRATRLAALARVRSFRELQEFAIAGAWRSSLNWMEEKTQEAGGAVQHAVVVPEALAGRGEGEEAKGGETRCGDAADAVGGGGATGGVGHGGAGEVGKGSELRGVGDGDGGGDGVDSTTWGVDGERLRFRREAWDGLCSQRLNPWPTAWDMVWDQQPAEYAGDGYRGGGYISREEATAAAGMGVGGAGDPDSSEEGRDRANTAVRMRAQRAWPCYVQPNGERVFVNPFLLAAKVDTPKQAFTRLATDAAHDISDMQAYCRYVAANPAHSARVDKELRARFVIRGCLIRLHRSALRWEEGKAPMLDALALRHPYLFVCGRKPGEKTGMAYSPFPFRKPDEEPAAAEVMSSVAPLVSLWHEFDYDLNWASTSRLRLSIDGLSAGLWGDRNMERIASLMARIEPAWQFTAASVDEMLHQLASVFPVWISLLAGRVCSDDFLRMNYDVSAMYEEGRIPYGWGYAAGHELSKAIYGYGLYDPVVDSYALERTPPAHQHIFDCPSGDILAKAVRSVSRGACKGQLAGPREKFLPTTCGCMQTGIPRAHSTEDAVWHSVARDVDPSVCVFAVAVVAAKHQAPVARNSKIDRIVATASAKLTVALGHLHLPPTEVWRICDGAASSSSAARCRRWNHDEACSWLHKQHVPSPQDCLVHGEPVRGRVLGQIRQQHLKAMGVTTKARRRQILHKLHTILAVCTKSLKQGIATAATKLLCRASGWPSVTDECGLALAGIALENGVYDAIIASTLTSAAVRRDDGECTRKSASGS